MQDLLDARLAEECGAGASQGGRKPQMVAFNARCGFVLGAVIGVQETRLWLADMDGTLLGCKRFAFDAATKPRALFRRIATAARALLNTAGADEQMLRAAVVGAPGMTNVETGVVLEAAYLSAWRNVPARDLLQQELGAHFHITIDNDVNLAALGEQWRGQAQTAKNFAFLMIGAGIGAGLVIDGKVYRGQRWHAGEISHLNLDYRAWATDFGAAGYLETHLCAPLLRGQQKHPRTTRKRQANARLNDENLLRLGAAIANLATLLDPELIVIGGDSALTDEALLRRVETIAQRIAPNCPPLQATALGADAVLHGSLRVALDRAHENLFEQARRTALFAAAA